MDESSENASPNPSDVEKLLGASHISKNLSEWIARQLPGISMVFNGISISELLSAEARPGQEACRWCRAAIPGGQHPAVHRQARSNEP